MNPDMAILYVEDDPLSRKVMEMTLKFRMRVRNVTVFEESSNFPERVQALDPRPDVIFLDIHVKPHSGFEMLKMLRDLKKFEDIPIVALTASVMNEEVAMLRTAGFDGCFSKPLDVDSFEDGVKAVLKGEQVWRIL
jgi:CheY-like chemotaxis protein